MKRKMKITKGFTMIELIITMTIVIVLSLISWPIYRGLHSKEYTILGEGYALLGAIKEAQINYYNEYGYFLNPRHSFGQSMYSDNSWTANEPVLGINSMNNKYFSWFNAYDGTKNAYTQFGGLTSFTAVVRSKDYGTIVMPFNLTERSEITVLNAKNVTM